MKSIVAAGGTAAVVAAALAAPGAAASESVDGDVEISNTETVAVLMGADGDIKSERVYEQLVLSGKGAVDVSNPVSTDKLRNLDGFRGWDVNDGAQRIKTDVDGKEKFRSVSAYDKDLPVSVDVDYLLDGKKVEPGDVVGKSGELQVTYSVRNETGKQQEVTYTDGEGKTKTTTQAVVIPMVGSLTTVLPSSFRNVRPDGANAAGDGKGGTQLSFTVTLFPPIGSDRATFGYTAEIEDGLIPKASLSLLPVNPLENNSFKGGAESYKGGADKGVDLTAGAVTIDENLLKIRDGANDLVDGLLQLRDGAGELNAGLAGKAAPGAGELSAGAGQLDGGVKKLDAGAKKLKGGTGDLDAGAKKLKDGAGQLNKGAGDLDAGAKKLNTGAGELAAGLKEAKAGGPLLLEGVKKLSDGAEGVDRGLVALQGAVSNGVGSPADAAVEGKDSLRGGVAQLTAGIVGTGNPQAPGVLEALNEISDALGGASGLLVNLPDGPLKQGLQKYIDGAKAGVDNTALGINERLVPGLKKLDGGLATLNSQVSGAVGTPTSMVPTPEGESPSLRNGVGQISDGLAELSKKGGALAEGLQQLSSGADKLSVGTRDLKGGTSQLKGGASQLAVGTGDLKDGTGKLNAGAGDLVDGTGQLSDGSGRLSEGAGTLSSGLLDAATGSGKLFDGLGTAADKAPDLPEGADKLSKEGTSQLVNVGNGTAMDFGLKYALIEAGAARAAEAQPYGSPSEATALTAYKYELAAEEGEGAANGKRGIAVALLAAGALALLALRRRGLTG